MDSFVVIQVQRYTNFANRWKKVCMSEIICIFAIGFGQKTQAKSIEALYFFLWLKTWEIFNEIQESVMVRAVRVDCLLHLNLRYFLRTLSQRRGIQHHASFYWKCSLAVLERATKSCARHELEHLLWRLSSGVSLWLLLIYSQWLI